MKGWSVWSRSGLLWNDRRGSVWMSRRRWRGKPRIWGNISFVEPIDCWYSANLVFCLDMLLELCPFFQQRSLLHTKAPSIQEKRVKIITHVLYNNSEGANVWEEELCSCHVSIALLITTCTVWLNQHSTTQSSYQDKVHKKRCLQRNLELLVMSHL